MNARGDNQALAESSPFVIDNSSLGWASLDFGAGAALPAWFRSSGGALRIDSSLPVAGAADASCPKHGWL